MIITRWNSQRKVNQSEIEELLRSEGLEPFLWQDGAGTYYPTHSHSYEEVRWVIEGSVTFGVQGEEVILNPGDRLDLPAGTEHYAKVSDKHPTIYLCASKHT